MIISDLLQGAEPFMKWSKSLSNVSVSLKPHLVSDSLVLTLFLLLIIQMNKFSIPYVEEGVPRTVPYFFQKG